MLSHKGRFVLFSKGGVTGVRLGGGGGGGNSMVAACFLYCHSCFTTVVSLGESYGKHNGKTIT